MILSKLRPDLSFWKSKSGNCKIQFNVKWQATCCAGLPLALQEYNSLKSLSVTWVREGIMLSPADSALSKLSGVCIPTFSYIFKRSTPQMRHAIHHRPIVSELKVNDRWKSCFRKRRERNGKDTSLFTCCRYCCLDHYRTAWFNVQAFDGLSSFALCLLLSGLKKVRFKAPLCSNTTAATWWWLFTGRETGRVSCWPLTIKSVLLLQQGWASTHGPFVLGLRS